MRHYNAGKPDKKCNDVNSLITVIFISLIVYNLHIDPSNKMENQAQTARQNEKD